MSDAIVRLLVSDDNRTSLSGHESAALALLPDIEMLAINSPEDEQFAVNVREAFKDEIKSLETMRKSITAPMAAAKKAVDALFKPATDRYERMVELINGRLKERELARLAATSAAKALAVAAARTGESVTVAEAAPRAVGVSYVYKWVPYIKDVRLVPDVWTRKEIDQAKVMEHCKTWAHSEVIPPIPGIEFVRDATLRSNGK